MHVCVVTTAHPLDDVRVKSKIVDSFLDAGWNVSWVGPEKSFFADTSERDDRVTYHLAPHAPGKIQRLAAIPRVARLASRLKGVDWIYCPDPDAATISVLLARRIGAKVLFDIHEEFHLGLLDRWTGGHNPSWLASVVKSALGQTCRCADLVIGVNESVLRPYTRPGREALVVRNTAPAWFVAADRWGDPIPDRLTASHGKALPSNGTPVVLEALGRLVRADVPVRVLLFPSAGPLGSTPYMPELKSEAARLGITEYLWLHDAVTHDQMPPLLHACQLGMIAYGRTLGVGSLPNRLFEYMAQGMAILAPRYSTEIRAIVEAEDIGRTADFEDPEDVAAAIRWFVEHPEETRAMGERAKVAFVERYSWDAEFAKLLSALEKG